LPLSTEEHKSSDYHSEFTQLFADFFGNEGEEKVFKLLKESKKIKFRKLVKDWREIEDLQIDIYAETENKVYFIEVKN
jgi:predicted naringenin-chalcone synthase